MLNKRKSERIRIILYSLCSLIVGCAVGAALLMKVVTEGDARRTQHETAAAQQAAETLVITTAAPETETLPPETVTEPAETEPPVTEPPVTEPPPPDETALRAIIANAEPLLQMTYCYTDSDCYEIYSEFWGSRMPFTTDTVILTCDGTICVGIAADEIEYEVDGETKEITVLLPEPEVLSHEIDPDSIRYYDVKNSLFKSSTLEDYNEFMRDFKDSICEKVMAERDFGALAAEQAKTVVRSCFAAADITKDYTVDFIE